ncbi:deuterosome assembly protein 1 isoform X4 [Columba livia]|uniref:deuterosome assembly protein 1 isoform X4 n=1 Tax=Columba livia TaxID=8932 RepID=UPI0031BB6A6B
MEQDLEMFQEQAATKASPSEAELQELVDIVVNSQKVAWERKMKALEAKMDIQVKELASAQSKLDQKGQEVGLLQQKLEDLKKTKYEMAQNYETQLQVLKSQVSKLTHSYEELQSHQVKQKKAEYRQECEESLEAPSELRNLYKKMENMEVAFSEMRNELQSRDALWRKIQLECQQLHAELSKIREYKDMQETQTKHQLSYAQLTEQLENRTAELLLLAQSEEHQQEELKKIRNHVYQEKQSHRSEQERMKTEISDLTEELHQKEITIATIVEKAGLLERQLKMELELKDKLLAKQQLLDFQYKVIKSENTHLKEMLENQECKSCMTIDLSNKEHGNFTASIPKLEHENVRLQNSLVKLQNDTETSILSHMDLFRETENSCQTHSKMQEKEKRTFQKEDEWEMERQQTAMFRPSGYHRNCSPALYGQHSITGSKSDSTLSPYALDRGHEQKTDDKSPSPPTGYPLGFGGLFPEKGRTGSLLSPAYNAEENKLSAPSEMSFLAATEKFLQEEEKHTREFEELLNSHLEELQRHSENTLKKYARIQQNRHN